MQRTMVGMLVTLLVACGAVEAVPAVGQVVGGSPASQSDAVAAGQFIANLADKTFSVLKENQSKPAIKAKFRTMLKDNFAVDEAGMKLIRRYRNQITPAQLAAYQAVLPDYIVNVYADRLINYSNAVVKIVRTQPHGSSGDVDVFSKIGVPGRDTFDIIWLVQRGTGGKWLIGNVTVSGVNMSLTQEADFSGYIAKNGFDALVGMMKAANGKAI